MSHKLRIEASCVEASLKDAVNELKLMLKASGNQSLELKVFGDINREAKGGHKWVQVNVDARTEDIVKIYELEKQLNHD